MSPVGSLCSSIELPLQEKEANTRLKVNETIEEGML